MEFGQNGKRISSQSKVKFDLDGSQTIETSIDEIDVSSPSTNDKMNSNHENKSTTKKYSRKMSGLHLGSFSVRPTNGMSTPKELCEFLGGTRVINKVRHRFSIFLFISNWNIFRF